MIKHESEAKVALVVEEKSWTVFQLYLCDSALKSQHKHAQKIFKNEKCDPHWKKSSLMNC